MLLLAAAALFSAEPSFSFRDTVTLKRNETAVYAVQIGETKKELIFRWTLFTNDGLVVLANYDRFPHQFVLEQKYRQSGFSITLSDFADVLTQTALATVVFKEFDKKSKLCTFELLVRDDKGMTLIERQKPNK